MSPLMQLVALYMLYMALAWNIMGPFAIPAISGLWYWQNVRGLRIVRAFCFIEAVEHGVSVKEANASLEKISLPISPDLSNAAYMRTAVSYKGNTNHLIQDAKLKGLRA